MRTETINFALLDFPEEYGEAEEAQWLRDRRKEVEGFCGEYCFRLGSLYILPKTYLFLVDDFLQHREAEYHKRGHDPFFKVMSISLPGDEYVEILEKVLERIQSRLENYLKAIEEEGPSEKLVSRIFKEAVKTRELILVFQLERLFPKEVMKIQDLTGILDEKTVEMKLSLSPRVEVTEI